MCVENEQSFSLFTMRIGISFLLWQLIFLIKYHPGLSFMLDQLFLASRNFFPFRVCALNISPSRSLHNLPAYSITSLAIIGNFLVP